MYFSPILIVINMNTHIIIFSDKGLVIQGIEPGGRIYKDGRLAVGDKISEINGTSLLNVDFNKYVSYHRQDNSSSHVTSTCHITDKKIVAVM